MFQNPLAAWDRPQTPLGSLRRSPDALIVGVQALWALDARLARQMWRPPIMCPGFRFSNSGHPTINQNQRQQSDTLPSVQHQRAEQKVSRQSASRYFWRQTPLCRD